MPLIRLRNHWEETFFKQYVRLQDTPLEQQQMYDDLKKLYGPHGCLNQDWDWEAIILDSAQKKPLAAVLWTYPKSGKLTFLPCGFFGFSKEFTQGQEIQNELKVVAKSYNLDQIKAPIDGHFFFQYRWTISRQTPALYGEPDRPSHFTKGLINLGFTQQKTWDSVLISTDEMRTLCLERIQKSYPQGVPNNLRIEHIGFSNWEDYLIHIHKLFTESYKDMDEYMPISLEAFKTLYGPYKHIVEPQTSVFLFEDNKATAFLVGYRDPGPAIQKYSDSKLPNPFKKLKLLWDLKNHRGQTVFPYVGRDPNAKGSKGAMAVLFNEVLKNVNDKEFIGAYLAEGSPSYRTLPQNLKPHASYATYIMKI